MIQHCDLSERITGRPAILRSEHPAACMSGIKADGIDELPENNNTLYGECLPLPG